MTDKFTEAQKKAIKTTDRSVLVAAAAGAGKTTVLINRIIGIILEGRADVDEMLVVTFTNAAASEMRLRLSSAIRQRIREHPEDSSRMREQLSRLYRANISTIDKFTLRLVREFFHEADIEPNFTICDDVQAELMQREAASELIEEAFEDDSLIDGGSFREFMRLYGDERSDARFSDNMISSYAGLRTMPDYFEWAYEKAEDLKVDLGSFDSSTLGDFILIDAKDTFETACSAAREIAGMIESAGLGDFLERKLRAEFDRIYDIYDELSKGNMNAELLRDIDSIEWARLTPSSDEKESWEEIKSDVKEVRDSLKTLIKDFTQRYMSPDLETCLKENSATYRYSVYYLKLLEEFERRYLSKKKEKKVMDLSDVSHAASEILKNEEVAETLRRRFEFVFVDEYQDTNRIQEFLIDKVSRPDNVFKVGDVKQSIYKFRLAEPEIFEHLQRKYADEFCEEGMLINLSENFRTNPATIAYVNHVFEEIMEGYDSDAKLVAGIEDIPPAYDFKPEVHVLLKGEQAAEDLSNDEAEAEYIARLAAGIIGTEFYDAKSGAVRKAEARDIAILMRSVKYSGETIASALAALSVDSHIEETDDYFNTLEIDIALSLLSCIDNLKRDIPLIASLRSEVFGFMPEELAEIRIAYDKQSEEKREPYWRAFTWYAGEGPDEGLRSKTAHAESSIREWRRLSRIMPLSDFIWKVLVDSGYYAAAGAMNGGGRRQANLRALADRAASYSSSNIGSLSSFINFVDVMKSREISNGQAPMAGKDDDLVRIMTMHKSKGLEFPFVIVGGLGRRFNRDGASKKFSFDSSMGIGMPYVDPDRRYWRSSMTQLAMKAKYDRDCYKEDIRLLYVDMTRARNKLFLVGSVNSMDSLMKFGKPLSYLKVIKDMIMTPYNEYHIVPLAEVHRAEKKEYKDKIKPINALSGEAAAIYDELDRRFAFIYPNADEIGAKAKYSVSSIRLEELQDTKTAASEGAESESAVSEEELIRLWEGSESRKKAGAADIGIAYHRIMEFLDFNKVMSVNGDIDTIYIREQAEYLRDQDAIDEDVYAAIDMDKIVSFFESDIGQRALAAARLGLTKKEKAFTLKTNRRGREMLVQGVIDCCFEEAGSMVLIDYKSNYIRRGAGHDAEIKRIRDEYKTQIELYSEALEKGSGLKVKEAYLYLFDISEAVRM